MVFDIEKNSLISIRVAPPTNSFGGLKIRVIRSKIKVINGFNWRKKDLIILFYFCSHNGAGDNLDIKKNGSAA